jgi:hypothetical protein
MAQSAARTRCTTPPEDETTPVSRSPTTSLTQPSAGSSGAPRRARCAAVLRSIALGRARDPVRRTRECRLEARRELRERVARRELRWTSAPVPRTTRRRAVRRPLGKPARSAERIGRCDRWSTSYATRAPDAAPRAREGARRTDAHARSRLPTPESARCSHRRRTRFGSPLGARLDRLAPLSLEAGAEVSRSSRRRTMSLLRMQVMSSHTYVARHPQPVAT